MSKYDIKMTRVKKQYQLPKWTDGKPYERTRRLSGQELLDQLEQFKEENFVKEVEKDAYLSSLNHDENSWDILNNFSTNAGFKISNKREELDTKISERELLQQIGFNPFLSDNTYLHDIHNHDKFLKPLNTK
jgi:hypothetical protein